MLAFNNLLYHVYAQICKKVIILVELIILVLSIRMWLMLKAVIFDMDGVIIDSEPIYHEIEMTLFRELVLGISEKEQRSYAGTKTGDMWSELKEKYGIEKSVEELVELEAKRYREYLESGDGLRLIPGVVHLIEELSVNDVIIAVASSSSPEDIETVLSTFNRKNYFKIAVSGIEVQRGKPAPDIFELTVKRLEVLPEECIVIEDSGNGVKAAKAAGIKCVGLRSLNSGNQDLSAADLIIESFGEINYKKLKALCEEM